MNVPKSELFSVLQEFNPWWTGQPVADLPEWERSAAAPIRAWIGDRGNRRSLLLSGARQVGKTTLFRQAIRRLVSEGFPAGNVLYPTFLSLIVPFGGIFLGHFRSFCGRFMATGVMKMLSGSPRACR